MANVLFFAGALLGASITGFIHGSPHEAFLAVSIIALLGLSAWLSQFI